MRSLLRYFGQPIFLVLNVLGAVFLIASQFVPQYLHPWFVTIGSSILTIGITLPVALYYQIQSNSQANKILDTCNRAGIESIYISRKKDSIALRLAIDEAAGKSSNISLLGIAFHTFLNPSAESTDSVRNRLNSPSVNMRILLLRPDSDCAKKRAAIEQGNATLNEIEYSINNCLTAIAQERVEALIKGKTAEEKNKIMQDLRNYIQLAVRTYDSQPAVFLMMFDDYLFTEQYHIGRPKRLVPVGSCIGKYMPVIQYRRGSAGYEFLDSHFNKMWDEARDETDTIIREAKKRIGEYV